MCETVPPGTITRWFHTEATLVYDYKTKVKKAVQNWYRYSCTLGRMKGGRNNSSISVQLKVSLKTLNVDVSWTGGEDLFLRRCTSTSMQQLF